MILDLVSVEMLTVRRFYKNTDGQKIVFFWFINIPFLSGWHKNTVMFFYVSFQLLFLLTLKMSQNSVTHLS